MGNLFDDPFFSEGLLKWPSKEECQGKQDQLVCRGKHALLCPSKEANERCFCGSDWWYKIISGVSREIEPIDEVLGPVCKCCGSIQGLCVKTVRPLRYLDKQGQSRPGSPQHLLKKIAANPGMYVRLCKECSEWKGDGPCCPCSYWDTIDPVWRTYR